MQRVGSRPFETEHGRFECAVFRDRSGGVHMALTHGRWNESDEVLVRVHEPLTVVDLLDATGNGHSWALPRALAALRAAPCGVAVLLNCGTGPEALLGQLLPAPGAPASQRSTMDLRTYGVGAQILRELGIRRMKLLGSPRRMPSMTGYGLEITGFLPATPIRDH